MAARRSHNPKVGSSILSCQLAPRNGAVAGKDPDANHRRARLTLATSQSPCDRQHPKKAIASTMCAETDSSNKRAAADGKLRPAELHGLPHRPSCHTQLTRDSLAEWSKALAQGASPQGRGFEPHSCHLGARARERAQSTALGATAPAAVVLHAQRVGTADRCCQMWTHWGLNPGPPAC